MGQAKRAYEEQMEADQPRVINALYRGECSHCNEVIEVGQRIGTGAEVDDRNTPWMHVECIELSAGMWHQIDKDD